MMDHPHLANPKIPVIIGENGVAAENAPRAEMATCRCCRLQASLFDLFFFYLLSLLPLRLAYFCSISSALPQCESVVRWHARGTAVLPHCYLFAFKEN